MASQRRAPTKRPPRPPAKKTPAPGTSDGVDAAENATTKTTDQAPAKAPTKASAKATAKSPAPTPAKTNRAPSAPAKGSDPTNGSGGPAEPAATKSSSTATKATATAAKSSGGAGAGLKTGSSGPNYRPPTGTRRSTAGRTLPPPRRKKKFTTKTVVAGVALVLVASLVIFFALAVNGSSGNSTQVAANLLGPEQVAIPSNAILASVSSGRYPQTIDGIKCQTNEQAVYHIHAHLTIFVNGQAKDIPYGVGIEPPLQTTDNNGSFVSAGTCFYWLHTHAADGIIHVESPTQTTYNLGQFFDVWGQPLDSGRVGPVTGKVTVYLDGKPYPGDPRLIPLQAHSQIQLNVNSPNTKPVSITFPSGL